jgi:hypothetical protein
VVRQSSSGGAPGQVLLVLDFPVLCQLRHLHTLVQIVQWDRCISEVGFLWSDSQNDLPFNLSCCFCVHLSVDDLQPE